MTLEKCGYYANNCARVIVFEVKFGYSPKNGLGKFVVMKLMVALSR